MSSIFFHLSFSPDKVKNIEKSSPNCAQLFLHNKYTVFTIGGNSSSLVPHPNFL